MGKYNYYGMLNESFDKLLLEAQQIVIDFKNIFGADTYDRFAAQKQRMPQPVKDISYWVKQYKDADEEGKQDVINRLGDTISEYEGKKTRSQKAREASEGADLIFEDDNWLVYHITSYKAAAKYGSHTCWCITGRYQGHEDRGEYWFNHYLEDQYDGYYFFIKKGNDEEKYCVCPRQDGDGYDIWDPKDDRPEYVPNGPTDEVPGLPGLPVEENNDYDYGYDEEEADDDDFDEPDDEPEEPVEWTDENGNTHRGHRPPEPASFELIQVNNPDEFEFPANTREDAIRAFAAHGFEGAEFEAELQAPLCIVHFTVEPTHEEFPMGEDDVYVRDLPGDRYTAFVFIPGQGGGPLMTQDGKVLAHRSADGVRRQFGQFNPNDIHRDEERRQQGHENESLQEGFYYFDCTDDECDESCSLDEGAGCYAVFVGDEEVCGLDNSPRRFSSKADADRFAREDMELLDGDFDVKEVGCE